MFDYRKFEDDVVQQMEHTFQQWVRANDGIYIIALDCSGGMESIAAAANTTYYLEQNAQPSSSEYWYYKYCEEEWELFHPFDALSAEMGAYLEENSDAFSDPETHEYTDAFDAHYEKIADGCVNALVRFRKDLNKTRPDILLTLNIRECLDAEERIKIFARVNPKSAAEEYAAHIAEYT